MVVGLYRGTMLLVIHWRAGAPEGTLGWSSEAAGLASWCLLCHGTIFSASYLLARVPSIKSFLISTEV